MKPFSVTSSAILRRLTHGRQMNLAVEDARQEVAALLGASEPSEIVFTSCGSESDNWAI